MFIINVPHFNIDQIYKSGQVFNWYKIDESKYIVVKGNKVVRVEQKRDTIIFSCTEDDFYDTWYDYFDLGTPYDELHYRYKRLGGHFKISCNRCSGMHICKQDLFEVIIASCLETATSITRTRQMVMAIARKCGKRHKQSIRGEVVWYEFPTPKQILSKKHKLTTQDVGYKLDVILGICNDIVDGWLDLDLLSEMDYEDALDYLVEFKGIGNKVANSICLFGLHHMQAFPLDTHMNKMLESKFDMTFEEFMEWYLSEVKYVDNIGYIRQVLFYNELYPVTEKNYDWTQDSKKSIYKHKKRNILKVLKKG